MDGYYFKQIIFEIKKKLNTFPLVPIGTKVTT